MAAHPRLFCQQLSHGGDEPGGDLHHGRIDRVVLRFGLSDGVIIRLGVVKGSDGAGALHGSALGKMACGGGFAKMGLAFAAHERFRLRRRFTARNCLGGRCWQPVVKVARPLLVASGRALRCRDLPVFSCNTAASRRLDPGPNPRRISSRDLNHGLLDGNDEYTIFHCERARGARLHEIATGNWKPLRRSSAGDVNLMVCQPTVNRTSNLLSSQ